VARGGGKKVAAAAVGEFSFNLEAAKLGAFFLAAVVSVDNDASKAVAASVFGDEMKKGVDPVSGEKICSYRKMFGAAPNRR